MTVLREAFRKDLEKLRHDVLDMADLARGMLADGVRALETLDAELANRVLERKTRLAELDDAIEDSALHLVARQQPMASDLRAVAAALKLITYINRVGRYGKDIAQVVPGWGTQPHLARLVQIPFMTELVLAMFDMVIAAYRTGKDLDVAKLADMEDKVDASRHTVFRECLTYMMQDPKNIERGQHYVMIARYLERSADNVCKMAEKTHYMITGERLMIR